ncbi:hypothetical protein NFI96_027534 [Prochilodus magdalenae]|nr:hypothetical protein NFI96_027534 [Prochilodus magdalenae]
MSKRRTRVRKVYSYFDITNGTRTTDKTEDQDRKKTATGGTWSTETIEEPSLQITFARKKRKLRPNGVYILAEEFTDCATRIYRRYPQEVEKMNFSGKLTTVHPMYKQNKDKISVLGLGYMRNLIEKKMPVTTGNFIRVSLPAKCQHFNRKKLFEIKGTLKTSAEDWKSEITDVVRAEVYPKLSYRGGRSSLGDICENYQAKPKTSHEELKGITPRPLAEPPAKVNPTPDLLSGNHRPLITYRTAFRTSVFSGRRPGKTRIRTSSRKDN